MTKYLAFDIETAKITPEGDDIQSHRPLGICCWAVALQDDAGDIVTRSYCGTDLQGSNTARLDQTECQAVVKWLLHRIGMGFTILTHNGVGFDFDILAEESGLHKECAELAMASVDTCLFVHCHKGFPVGLDAIARGMGMQGKTEGMNGSLAPVMWADGKHEEVMAYCAQDVRSTLEVALEIERRKALIWIAKSGRHNTMPVPKLLTVQECLALPEPNTSWMTEPMPRSRFVGWMERKKAA